MPEAQPVTTEPKRRKPPVKQHGMLAKPSKDAADLTIKYDIPIPEAYQIVTGKQPDPRTVQKISERVEKWSLRHPAALKSASKTIRAFAAGQAVGGTINPETGELEGQIKPKDSTVLAAAQRIIDQVDPIIRKSEQVNVNIDVDPVDLGLFRRRATPIDAACTVIDAVLG